MKLTYEDKVKIYKLWKEDHYGPRYIAKQFNIDLAFLKYLLKLVDLYGLNVVEKKSNNKYSKEIKEQAINRVLIDNESQKQVALSLALPNAALLSFWIKSYKENGIMFSRKSEGVMAKKKQQNKESELQKQIQDLQKKNLQLLIENEFLKKLDALITEREKRESKK